ncbi:hypothetical protein, partial [Enterococcus faecium]
IKSRAEAGAPDDGINCLFGSVGPANTRFCHALERANRGQVAALSGGLDGRDHNDIADTAHWHIAWPGFHARDGPLEKHPAIDIVGKKERII